MVRYRFVVKCLLIFRHFYDNIILLVMISICRKTGKKMLCFLFSLNKSSTKKSVSFVGYSCSGTAYVRNKSLIPCFCLLFFKSLFECLSAKSCQYPSKKERCRLEKNIQFQSSFAPHFI